MPQLHVFGGTAARHQRSPADLAIAVLPARSKSGDARYTRHYTFRVRQQKVQLVTCTAIEEHPDGAEVSANNSLTWDYENGDVILTLTRDYLRPNQAVTLHWEVTREPA